MRCMILSLPASRGVLFDALRPASRGSAVRCPSPRIAGSAVRFPSPRVARGAVRFPSPRVARGAVRFPSPRVARECCSMPFAPRREGVLFDSLLPASRGEGGRRPDEGKAQRTSNEWHYATISVFLLKSLPSADQIFTSSTRRFFARPASSALSAKGLSEPKPLELIREGSIPKPINAPSTLRARSVDN
jgi:hypothetical protein